jgi:dTDP-glucose 4,6-dehydratase
VKILVTGGAGFIGSCFVRQTLDEGTDSVVVLDALTYAGNLENLDGLVGSDRFEFVRGSICDAETVAAVADGCDAIVNFAAESHVDRSIADARVFLETNINGPRTLMDVARERSIRFLQVSTDEVYGSLGAEGLFTETSPLAPSSPYAASKAAADLLVGAYVRTFGLDALITRCGNNYGPQQFPEKLIPLFITNALEDNELPLYGDGLNIRDWIHVEDHCRAIRVVLEDGRGGSVFNVSAASERTNKEVCEVILTLLGKSWGLVRHIEDRPGHDRRYALDAGRLCAELGWEPGIDFDEGLATTVAWYRDNRSWWEHVKSGEYRDYYDKLYAGRLARAGTKAVKRAKPAKPANGGGMHE